MEQLNGKRFEQILLPVDFSDHNGSAAAYAAWFAGLSGGTIHLIHVIPDPLDALYTPEEVARWDLVGHAERKAKELLEAMARRCLPTGCNWEAHVFVGNPYERLLGAAQALGADVIIMSTHGHSGLAQLVIGSVTEKMVRHSKWPVFVVPAKTPDPKPEA